MYECVPPLPSSNVHIDEKNLLRSAPKTVEQVANAAENNVNPQATYSIWNNTVVDCTKPIARAEIDEEAVRMVATKDRVAPRFPHIR